MQNIQNRINRIKRQLLLVIVAIIVFNIAGTAMLYNISSKQKSDAIIINLSGAQRMLSQRMTKEVLKISIYKDQAKKYKDQLQIFCDRFDLVLNGLRYGNPDLKLPAAKDKIVLTKLDQVFKLWRPFKDNIKAVINSQNSNINNEVSMILQLNNQLLEKMDQTVKTFEIIADNHLKNTTTMMFIISFCIILIAVTAWFLLVSPLLKTTAKLLIGQQDSITAQEKTAQVLSTINEQIEDQNRELQGFLNGVPFPVMVIDTNYNILICNSAVKKINNNIDPVKNRQKCHKVSHHRDTPCEGVDDPCPLLEAVKTKKAVTTVHNHYDERGNTRIVEVKATPMFNRNGDVDKIIETSYDITERINLQDSLSRSKENAISANKAKSEFLANMSHEIRTPLNAILGFADILFNKEEDENKKEQLKIIVNSSVNLKNLINDILDFSKIEAGKIEVNNSVIPIKNIIDQTVSMFFLSAKEKNITLDIFIDKKIPQFIIADEQKIKQILTNLMGNALKFTKQGSIKVSSELKDEHIAIKVSDSGIGIDQNKLENIFSAFEQADSSTTKKFGGTGLGLAISRSLALLLDGDITVSSRRDKGSVFEFSFKYKKAGQGIPQTYNLQTDHEIEKNQTFEGFSILVAEDDINNQKLIETILSDLKTDFTIAQNGAMAIERLKEKSFDLMLLDMQMPVKDGLETIIEIRDDLKIKKLPVIAFTANATSESVKKIRAAGCTDFLSKPAVKQKIQTMLSKYLTPENSQDRQHESNQENQRSERLQNKEQHKNQGTSKLSDSQKQQLILLQEQLENQLDIFDPVSLIKIADSFANKFKDKILINITNQIKSCADDFDEDGLTAIVDNIKDMQS
jgi:signal transduction histidine kinase/CheY-like chemotaxis protein